MSDPEVATRHGPDLYEDSEEFARAMDDNDPLRSYRQLFYLPGQKDGQECIYLAGNSLGLQPKKVKDYIDQELDDWANLGVEGHFSARHPWLPYHENLTKMTARLVGAKPIEVVVMNTLTVNLHLMMVSFYRPQDKRHKILIESDAFPSDQYAVASQAKWHGFEPKEAVVELTPREGELTLRPADILESIDRQGGSVALVMLGNVNYLTGQAFDMKAITEAAHAKGCLVGFNLAHGAGNLKVRLHDDDVDFAVWCGYKYLNAGPGALAGCFVHERHAGDLNLPRLAGWWGHDKQTRFAMGPEFDPIPGAEGWQLSNPPILPLAALRASLEIFDRATMDALREKSIRLTGYLEFLLRQMASNYVSIITPAEPEQRGCQLSLRVQGDPEAMLERLRRASAICDFRPPDIIRAAPVPLYNSFMDVYRFARALRENAR